MAAPLPTLAAMLRRVNAIAVMIPPPKMIIMRPKGCSTCHDEMSPLGSLHVGSEDLHYSSRSPVCSARNPKSLDLSASPQQRLTPIIPLPYITNLNGYLCPQHYS